jgi:hypothetical protein
VTAGVIFIHFEVPVNNYCQNVNKLIASASYSRLVTIPSWPLNPLFLLGAVSTNMDELGTDSVPDGMIYFCANSSCKSFAGLMDDAFSVSEDGISQWIYYTNSHLYQKLGGLPLQSSSLPSDGTTQTRERGEQRDIVIAFRPTEDTRPSSHLSTAASEDGSTEDTSIIESVVWDSQDHAELETQSFVLGRSLSNRGNIN